MSGRDPTDKAVQKEVGDWLNYGKNSLKHLEVGKRKDFNFDAKEMAQDAISRGLRNIVVPPFNAMLNKREIVCCLSG